MENSEYSYLIRDAINGLASDDQNWKNASGIICQKFQNPCGFSFPVFLDLSDESAPLNERMFAYSSLTNVIKDSWSKIDANKKQIISEAFPFINGHDMNTDPLMPNIASAAASYLAFAGTNQQTIEFFISFSDVNTKFTVWVFNEYAAFISPSNSSKFRIDAFDIYNDPQFPNLMFKLFFEPLAALDPYTEDFSFFLMSLSRVHQNSPNLIDINLKEQRSVDVYIKLCSLLWEMSDNFVVTIFESLLSREKVPKEIINSLLESLPTLIPNYSNLYIMDKSISSEEFNGAIKCFNMRIKLLPLIFSKTDPRNYSDELLYYADLLESVAPSVTYEASTITLAWLKTPANIFSNEIKAQCADARLRLVDVCIAKLITKIPNWPGSTLDEGLVSQQLVAQLEDIVRVIIENYDIKIIFYLFDALTNEMGNDRVVKVLMKIIKYVLNENKQKIIGKVCVRVSIDFLSSINTFQSSMQTNICSFLIKMIPCMEFSEFSENDYFTELIDLLIEFKPISLEPFSQYILAFMDRFKNLEIPVDKLKNIPAKHPIYKIATMIIAKVETSSSDPTFPTESALNDIRWLVKCFKPTDKDMKKLSTDVAKSMQIISGFSFSGWEGDTEKTNFIDELCSLLVSSANILARVIDNSNKPNINNQVIALYSNIGMVFDTLRAAAPKILTDYIALLRPPKRYKVASVIWLKKLAYPLSMTLYQQNKGEVEILSSSLCSAAISYINAIRGAKDSLEKKGNISAKNDLKKLALMVCDLCEMVENEQVEKSMKTILQLGDIGIYQSATKVLGKKDFQIILNLWPLLVENKGPLYIDALADLLLKFLNESGNADDIFRSLPNVKERNFIELRTKLGASTASKSKRRAIRAFLLAIINTK